MRNFFNLLYLAAEEDQKVQLDEFAAIREFEGNMPAAQAELFALADFFSQLANEHAHFTDAEQ